MSANVPITGLHYSAPGMLCVREFLHPYTHLLRAAGVQSLVDPTYHPPSEQQDDGSSLRSNFNAMRLDARLTDIILWPRSMSHIADDDQDRLRVHRALMAATVPHIQTMFSSGMKESKLVNPLTYQMGQFISSLCRIHWPF